ncbi:MAG: discoidin domain-containing protein, partial [Planctomycetes bacterium]|nr:discoidin domain-containing protein [Planctomycetota bacterium]
MRKHLTLMVVACLLFTTLAGAGINFQKWEAPAGNNDAIAAFLVDLLDPVPRPDEESVLDTAFFAGLGNNYIARMYGWVTVPTTGNYNFYVHSDDSSTLYISTDGELENATEVARVDGWVNVNAWQAQPTQTSATLSLQAGQIVAVSASMQDGTGGDHMGIAWTGPGISDITLIDDWVTEIAPIPTRAKNGGPADAATDVPPYSELAWRSGIFAAKHNVYLSDSFADVNDRSAAALVSDGQTRTTFDPDLALATTYYWAVDEVNAAPDFTIHAGKVWSFSVEPVSYSMTGVTATASSEFDADSRAANVVNGSGLTDGLHGFLSETMWLAAAGDLPSWIQFDLGATYKLEAMVVWNQNQLIESILGFGAKEVVVETSTDGTHWSAVAGATLFSQGPGAPDYAANTTFDMCG